MKKYILPLLLTTFILSACSFNGGNKEDLFQKKQDCAKLEPEMRKQLNSYERYGGELTNEDTLYMENVFYSPLRDSCLYTSDLITDSKKFNSIFHELEITDFFTKEVIYSKICVRGTSDKELKCSEEFESKIKELKGE